MLRKGRVSLKQGPSTGRPQLVPTKTNTDWPIKCNEQLAGHRADLWQGYTHRGSHPSPSPLQIVSDSQTLIFGVNITVKFLHYITDSKFKAPQLIQMCVFRQLQSSSYHITIKKRTCSIHSLQYDHEYHMLCGYRVSCVMCVTDMTKHCISRKWITHLSLKQHYVTLPHRLDNASPLPPTIQKLSQNIPDRNTAMLCISSQSLRGPTVTLARPILSHYWLSYW